MTALHHACIGGDLDCVINLIRKYPKDIEAGDEVRYSGYLSFLSISTWAVYLRVYLCSLPESVPLQST